jgi:hypothetical protein
MCNLFDLTTLWKKLVLSNMDQQVLDHHDPSSQNINEDINMDIDSHNDSSSSDKETDPFIMLLWNR